MDNKFKKISVPNLRKMCKEVFNHDCRRIRRQELVRRLSQVRITEEMIKKYEENTKEDKRNYYYKELKLRFMLFLRFEIYNFHIIKVNELMLYNYVSPIMTNEDYNNNKKIEKILRQYNSYEIPDIGGRSVIEYYLNNVISECNVYYKKRIMYIMSSKIGLDMCWLLKDYI